MGEWEDRGEGGRNGKCRERMGGMGSVGKGCEEWEDRGEGGGMGSVGEGWEEWEDRGVGGGMGSVGEDGRNGKTGERVGEWEV